MNQRRLLLIAAVFVAAIGTVLVLVYVRGADTRAAEGLDTVDVLTATQPIEIGESVGDADAAGKFATTSVTVESLLPGAQEDLAALEGLFATTRILPGEQIVTEKFGGESQQTASLAIPRDKVAASIELSDPQRVAGFVSPGSYVAVVYTGPGPASADGGAADTISRVLLRRVQVLGVGSTTPTTTTTTTEDGAQTTEQLPTTILTLALDEDEVTKINFAVAGATLSMALLTEDSEVSGLQATTPDNLFEN